MKKIKLNFLFPLATIVLSCIWIYKGVFEYGLWNEKNTSPKDGLFPALIAAVLLVVSVILFINSFKEEAVVFDKRAFLLIACLAVMYFISKYLGFLPTLLVFYVLWLKLYAKCNWKTTILATVVMSVIVYGAFSVWLKIRFPVGTLFKMLGFR